MFKPLLRPRGPPPSAVLRRFASTTAASSTMASRATQAAQPLRHVLRTQALRQTTQLPRQVSQFATFSSPSPPPPPYSQSPQRNEWVQARNLSVETMRNGTQWTRFTKPYSISSVRTFVSTRAQRKPNDEPANATTDPEAAQKIDGIIEEITELYGVARDEFEIAAEETEKNTTYAPDDRAAAREELDKLLEYYTGIIEGGDRAVAEEVKRRVGQRIRELEQAVLGMEEAATHGD